MPPSASQPNVVFVFGDQWRAAATGYAGDPNVKTPHIDRLAAESLNLQNACAGAPVCTPYRATLMTGQHSIRHGLFINDVPLKPDGTTLAGAFKDAGYATAYVGKWHIDGHGRYTWIPPERRLGWVDYWKVLECTHRYNKSPYYVDESDEMQIWEGYDAIAQTDDAIGWLRGRDEADGPFILALSWGPPHDPYQTAPQEYRDMYDPATLELRPNVPPEREEATRRDLAGYYAHCTVLDDCLGRVRAALAEMELAENTIFVFTSDHGDMLGSHGMTHKQKPWDESLRVPFLVHWPAGLGTEGRVIDSVIDSVDIMPTLLGLCGIAVPDSVQGLDRSPVLRGDAPEDDHAALYNSVVPFGQWTRTNGGRESRGLRTRTHTYVRDLNGPWLLYDNVADPYQQQNLAGSPAHAALQADLDRQLDVRLAAIDDTFEPGEHYIAKWQYDVNPLTLTAPHNNWGG